ncbi:MAG: type II toxin-antitoxin system VapC family toxin [Rhodoferax sp.]|nr:type II toxin-antitoxin system VapC family toxin [Rhodoferax sp.]
MIGLDTNVLVRYLAQDDARQAALASRLIETELTAARPGFISLVVLAELCWVLHRLYSATMDELIAMLDDLLGTPQFHLERRDVVQAAMGRFKAGTSRKAGVVDALIAQLAESEGCTHTVTFDKAAVRAAGMTLLA